MWYTTIKQAEFRNFQQYYTVLTTAKFTSFSFSLTKKEENEDAQFREQESKKSKTKKLKTNTNNAKTQKTKTQKRAKDCICRTQEPEDYKERLHLSGAIHTVSIYFFFKVL